MADILAAPATSVPDLMNDPEYDTNIGDGEDGMADANLCRICRGEGNDTEPLFHPCKCSGSIKFVHQDCLMEWLSHSQKKHCELCKTPFRFTKLYSPNMPQSLPTHVLFRHVIIHSAKNLAIWLRFFLVAMVWLGFVPFTIRQIWRLLFWFSDGGWPTGPVLKPEGNSTGMDILRQFQAANLAENGTCPVSPLQASPTTPAGVTGIVDTIIGLWNPASQKSTTNVTDALATGLLKSLAYGLGINYESSRSSEVQPSDTLPVTIRRSSLLSEVSFLRNLTRHPSINRLVITITEGYIITFLVVFCFILVFLIREWVVQQQPGINMGAGFNADFAAVPDPQADQRLLELPDVHEGAERGREVGAANVPTPREQRRLEARAANRRAIREETERIHELAVNDQIDPDPSNFTRLHALHAEEDRIRNADTWEDPEGPREAVATLKRPTAVRDALSPAAEVQRMLNEEPHKTEEFLAIWRRADSNPQEVLRIIDLENKGDEMRYWVNAMRMLENPELSTLPSSSADNSAEDFLIGSRGEEIAQQEDEPSNFPSDAAPTREVPGALADIKGKGKAQDDNGMIPLSPLKDGPFMGFERRKGTLNGQESEILIPRDTHLSEQERSEREKARRKFLDSNDWQTRWPGTESNTSTRPRSVSDGPTIRDSINPLAHNSWDFSSLNDDETDPSSMITENPESNQEFLSEANTPDHLQDIEYGSRPLIDDGPVEIIGLDGITRVHENWDEAFEANPIGDSETEEEQQAAPVPTSEATPSIPAEPQGVLGVVADFLWGGLGDDMHQDEPGPNDEHIVQDLANEAPFVPVGHPAFRDQDLVEAAVAAGIDPNDGDALDAIEDAEDFEGIMELVGMRGPIFSLIQNALFSVFLTALTVAFGVWIPYNIGRVSLLLIANPGPAFKLPLRFIFGCAAVVQDAGLLMIGGLSWVTLQICIPMMAWANYSSISMNHLAKTATNVSLGAAQRIVNNTFYHLTKMNDSDIFTFSAASHESLIFLRSIVTNTMINIGALISYPFIGEYSIVLSSITGIISGFLQGCWPLIKSLPTFLARPDSWVISLDVAKRSTPLDLDLSVWNGTDRFWAVTAGYTVICLLGAMYVSKGMPFSTGQVGREWEANIIDLLHQAGGVLKVILIISIEMLVFPLYCGLLLDAALLPLFDDTTIISRILFTIESPLTSIFVHWFVGTCYMFHFALFVSLCRKIMRKGVLYFIRDPDDPTFHPVRDVLERNVATQLRKILFSALVYGGLVVVCLGAVVWGLAYAVKGVLPIHWSSNEPVLEFPIDLLFYNFLMPLAVKFFKPSDGLHAMYAWWFRKCARMLRLTWFMFGERRWDEEGYVVHRTWGDFFRGISGDPTNRIKPDNALQPFVENPELRAYFHGDGRYVRAPASDQVRIPKGTSIFLEVDEKNHRIDKRKDRKDGVHGKKNDHYRQVYVPPWFQLRISLFIFSIWCFAAITGVSITIIPLALGRIIFAKIIPPHVRQNDIYAFSIGIYILGSILYAVLNMGKFVSWLKNSLALDADTPHHVLQRASSIALWILRITWIYTAFLIVLPTLYAAVIELYFITPLHTYTSSSSDEQHTIHFVQSWTLGLLYVKLTTRFILWFSGSRPARSIQLIVAKGYLDPDALLATRSFILPSVLVLGSALFWPWAVARVLIGTVFREEEARQVLVYRYAYPMALSLSIWAVALWTVLGWLRAWRMRIRDEVYLIGERLHNFGDRKVVNSGVSVPRMRRLDT